MARKTRRTQEESSDDEAPEVVSQSISKADAKRNQKALQDFATEEKARKRARNQERDQMLKERARVTKSGGNKEKVPGKRPLDLVMDEEDDDEIGDDEDGDNEVEARMLRAMRDAAGEVGSGEGEDEDEDDEFEGLGEMDSDGSDSGLAFGRDDEEEDDDDDDAEMSDGDGGSIDPEAPSDDEDMDEDDETTPPKPIVRKSNRKVDYLADDLFKAAFSAQNSQSSKNKKGVEPNKEQTVKKRRRKTTARVKDTVIGGRTIRTLPRTSDPRSQPTARSIPSARARKFLDQSLALKGKQALLKAKKRGWERRAANIGVMKYDGAPHGFARTTR